MSEEQGLVTVRNLKDSGEATTPLRDFAGVFDSYYPDRRDFGVYNILNFKSIEIFEVAAGEVYNFPIATIAIKASDKKNSGWGIFAESLAAFLSEDQDIRDCLQKRIRMKMDVGHIYGKDRNTGEDLIGNPWKVIELEGSANAPAGTGGAVSVATEQAKSLLNGKTKADFNKAFYADPLCRQDAGLQRSVTDGSFFTSMLQLGEFTEDKDGIFHRVAKA
jgi:hypothetical protein